MTVTGTSPPTFQGRFRSRLFTSSWTALWQISKRGPLPVIPVRISNGLPRFWPDAETFPVCAELIPPKWIAFGDQDREKAKKGYLGKLDTIGIDRIAARLDEIAKQHGMMPLALLCYEQDPAECHRSWVADWFQEHTGVEVPEVEPAPPAQIGFSDLVWKSPVQLRADGLPRPIPVETEKRRKRR